MAFKKDPATGIYQLDISVKKHRVQRSAFTKSREEANRLHAEERAKLWRKVVLKERPRRTWDEAVTAWVSAKELAGKRSLEEDRDRLRWITGKLTGKYLDEITAETLLELRGQRAAEPKVYVGADGGATSQKFLRPATINRYMAAISAVLHFAKSLQWISDVPTVEPLDEDNDRIVWASATQARALLRESPEHTARMVRYTLGTGIRKSNCAGLQWPHLSLSARRAFIPGKKFKNGKPFSYPLNDDVMGLLEEMRIEAERLKPGIERERRLLWVFTYEGEPIADPYTAAFRKACVRAGLVPGAVHGLEEGDEFHWHDLRHTWATWHAMSATPIHVLKELGGWRTLSMVERYYHLAESYTNSYAQAVNLDSLAGNIHVALSQAEKTREHSVKSMPGERFSNNGQAPDFLGGVADGTRTHDNRNHKPAED